MIFLGAFVLLLCGAEAVHTSEYYTAAVLEHVKVENPEDRQAAVRQNLDVFQEAATEAASLGADIIVYPEVGIMPATLMTRRLGVEYYEAIPDPLQAPSWTPCQNPNTTEDFPILTRLSCIARDNNIYVVANVGGKEPCSPQNNTYCPTDVQTLFYNTNVVFDSNGTLVARHRKRFPFFESEITRPSAPEYTVFNTSFGSFAVVICFDAVFVETVEVIERYAVDNLIVSTMWFDELPFVSAIQSYQGFALGLHVNVLAANLHQPGTGTIGSVIASRAYGSLKHTFKPSMVKSELLVARVPRSGSYSPEPNQTIITPSMEGYEHTNADTRRYNLTKLEQLSGSVEACNNGLCCRLNYTSNTQPDNFFLGAFNGIQHIEHSYFLCQEVCTLMLCTNGTNCTLFPTHSDVKFQSVSLSGNIQTRYQYPGVMASEMTLVPYALWNFSPGLLTVQDVDFPLLSATIHGRCYDRDPPFPDTEQRNSLNEIL